MRRNAPIHVPPQVVPLPGNQFTKVRLSPTQVAAYESMLSAQLQDALRVYSDSYANGLGAAGGDKLEAPWKCAGSVGRLATYKLMGAEHAGELGSFLQTYRTFGKVQGYYKDILGVHLAETTPEFRNVQKILYPDTIDAAVLHTIRSSTAQPQPPPPVSQQEQQHPAATQSAHASTTAARVTHEQYFGIKWIATASPSSDIRRRDCCFVEMLGCTTDQFGRELGFCVSASVAIPECPDLLDTKQITRFRMRHTMLIAPSLDAPTTTSEVFVTGVREVVDASLGTNAHHRHFMAILNDMSLVIDSRNITKQALLPRSEWVPDRARAACDVCCRKFHFLWRRRHHCRLCGEVVCRTCFVKRCVPSAAAIGAGGSDDVSGGSSEIAKDKFCVRCVMALRVGDRCIEDFSQQIHKVNSLRVFGRDSSISSDIGIVAPAFNSGSSYQLSSLCSGSSSVEKSGVLSARSSLATSSTRGSTRGSSITYYKRGSQQKKILRLEDLIKFPVEQPQDADPADGLDDPDGDDGDGNGGDMYSQAQPKRMMPIRLLSNDASMMELYESLVRLSQSSSAKTRSRRGGHRASGAPHVSITEVRQSIASQERMLSQIRQSLAARE